MKTVVTQVFQKPRPQIVVCVMPPYIPPPMVDVGARPRDVLVAMTLDEEVLVPRHMISKYRTAVQYQNTTNPYGVWEASLSPDSIRGEPPVGLVVKRVRLEV